MVHGLEAPWPLIYLEQLPLTCCNPVTTAKQNIRAYLDRVVERLQAQGIHVSAAMRTGGVADSIINYAQANQIDLIAMCTHGRTGRMRWTLGSVADRVLRAGHVPVLLVRAR